MYNHFQPVSLILPLVVLFPKGIEYKLVRPAVVNLPLNLTLPSGGVHLFRRLMTIIVWMFYLLFSVYFILDGIHTAILLEVGVKEANPLMAWVVTNFGIEGMFIVKISLTTFIGILVMLYDKQIKRREL